MTHQLTYDYIEQHLQRILQEQNKEIFPGEKLDYLFATLLSYYTDPFLMPFNTLFAQVSFAITQLKIPPAESFILHYYRIHFFHKNSNEPYQLECRIAAVHILAAAVFQEANRAGVIIAEIINIFRPEKKHDRIVPFCRMMVTAFTDNILYGNIEHDAEGGISVTIDAAINESLLRNIKFNLQYLELPLIAGLVGSKVKGNVYTPDYVILHPDFLLDVTAIAECFGHNYVISDLYFLKKFSGRRMTDAIFKGLLANYFLDELIRDKDIEFKTVAGCIFNLNPIFLAAKSDKEIRQLLEEAKTHFDNLKQIIQHQFPVQGIDIKHALLEPAFYAPEFGLQGRLDVLSFDKDHKTIVELKSGKLFKPNKYGLNQSNFIQTLLYNLLINPHRIHSTEIRTYMLYSAVLQGGLKFAPLTQSLQYEAMQVRNNMVTIDMRLSKITANGDDPTEVFNTIYQLDTPLVTGFTRQNLDILKNCYETLPELHKKYVRAYTGFITREFFLAKSGNLREAQVQGQSALWNQTYHEKDSTYAVLGHLRIELTDEVANNAVIRLIKSPQTNKLADFRAGDVVVLYASDQEGHFYWAGRQVFKGSLIENAPGHITLRLRNPQVDELIFRQDQYWNVEKDLMDSSFANQYASLGTFLAASERLRDLIIGRIPPENPGIAATPATSGMDNYELDIIWPALNCKDYYLIWGPPGTGKTSQFARELIMRLQQSDDKPVLVVAYTNKAVDELCEAIEKIPEISERYIRIGSRYSTAPAFASRLLEVQISDIKERKSLLDLMNRTRVVCGTVSSILGKSELFDLMQFEWLIIDEASQILDPYIIDLISRVERFIMIGDHKQLPAVVAQPPEMTSVTDPEMNAAGIIDLRLSVFERLFRQAVANNWYWCYGILTRQGRMHADIMSFPARHFYDGRLETLFEIQQLPMVSLYDGQAGKSGYKPGLDQKRVLFIDMNESNAGYRKMNQPEAELICKLLQDLEHIYEAQGQTFAHKSIGIITPFRAQIINIQNQLQQQGFELDCAVDTVERFQGGAKDIILISMVVSSPSQLKMIASTDADGLDRKMNVALTRARERVIMIGNAEVLRSSPYYARFIQEYLI